MEKSIRDEKRRGERVNNGRKRRASEGEQRKLRMVIESRNPYQRRVKRKRKKIQGN